MDPAEVSGGRPTARCMLARLPKRIRRRSRARGPSVRYGAPLPPYIRRRQVRSPDSSGYREGVALKVSVD